MSNKLRYMLPGAMLMATLGLAGCEQEGAGGIEEEGIGTGAGAGEYETRGTTTEPMPPDTMQQDTMQRDPMQEDRLEQDTMQREGAGGIGEEGTGGGYGEPETLYDGGTEFQDPAAENPDMQNQGAQGTQQPMERDGAVSQ